MSNRRSLIHLTMAGSRWEKKLLLPVSSRAMRDISESSNLKFSTSKFSAIRSLRVDLGVGPHRPRHPLCGSRREILLREALPAQDAARSRGSFMHQPTPPDLRRIMGVGFRARRPRAQSPCRRTTHFQQHLSGSRCRTRRLWACLYTGGSRATASDQGPAHLGAPGMVPTLARLPSLLSQPPPAIARFCADGRCAAPP